MTADLDTLLTALYVLIDDHVVPSGQRRPGRLKKLSNAELVCLAVAQVLLGARSEHHWLRMCNGRLGHLFSYLPHQPGYHKRVKAAAPLICQATLYLATVCPSWAGDLRLIDATPVPCGTSRQTVQRSELAGWANYGYCAAHSRWYWGLKLYLLTTPEGMSVAWCLADPKLGEREAAARLLRGHHDDWLAARLEELDTGNIGALLAAGRNLHFTGSLARERDRQLSYFQVNAHRMRYQHFRSLGMFIGSGVVEAGCKAVIGQRLKLSGMRWNIPGATAIATLRCQEASDPVGRNLAAPHCQAPRADLTTQAS